MLTIKQLGCFCLIPSQDMQLIFFKSCFHFEYVKTQYSHNNIIIGIELLKVNNDHLFYANHQIIQPLPLERFKTVGKIKVTNDCNYRVFTEQ